MRIDIYHHFPQGYEDKILVKLEELRRTLKMDLDTILQKVTDENTVIGGAVALLDELKTKLDEAIASGDSTKLQALADTIDAGKTSLANAIVANTPSA